MGMANIMGQKSAKIQILHFLAYLALIWPKIMVKPMDRIWWIFLHVKESELAYVHAENQCIWMVFGGQINSIYWFSWISVQYLGLKKTREIWLADFCHFLEKYTSEFNKNWDLAINS